MFEKHQEGQCGWSKRLRGRGNWRRVRVHILQSFFLLAALENHLGSWAAHPYHWLWGRRLGVSNAVRVEKHWYKAFRLNFKGCGFYYEMGSHWRVLRNDPSDLGFVTLKLYIMKISRHTKKWKLQLSCTTIILPISVAI